MGEFAWIMDLPISCLGGLSSQFLFSASETRVISFSSQNSEQYLKFFD